MMQLIVAMDLDRKIGNSNGLPWPRHKEDMQRFRKLTTGCSVVMGRKTFESMGSKPLPNRKNYVLSRSGAIFPGAETLSCKNDVIEREIAGENLWVIGGAEIYQLLWDEVDRIHLTVMRDHFPGDVSFPALHLDGYTIESRECFYTVTETNPIPHQYIVLHRKAPPPLTWTDLLP